MPAARDSSILGVCLVLGAVLAPLGARATEPGADGLARFSMGAPLTSSPASNAAALLDAPADAPALDGLPVENYGVSALAPSVLAPSVLAPSVLSDLGQRTPARL